MRSPTTSCRALACWQVDASLLHRTSRPSSVCRHNPTAHNTPYHHSAESEEHQSDAILSVPRLAPYSHARQNLKRFSGSTLRLHQGPRIMVTTSEQAT